MGQVLQEWANAKTAEVSLLEKLEIEKEIIRTALALENDLLREEAAAVRANLDRAYAELDRNMMTISGQTSKLTILNPMPAKVRILCAGTLIAYRKYTLLLAMYYFKTILFHFMIIDIRFMFTITAVIIIVTIIIITILIIIIMIIIIVIIIIIIIIITIIAIIIIIIIIMIIYIVIITIIAF